MPDIYDILKIKNEQGEWITVPALKGDAGNYTAGDNIIIEDDVISAIDTIYDDTEVKADIAALESGKADKAATYTKTEVDTALSVKADSTALNAETLRAAAAEAAIAADVTNLESTVTSQSSQIEEFYSLDTDHDGYSITATGEETVTVGFTASDYMGIVHDGDTVTFSCNAVSQFNLRVHAYDADKQWMEQIFTQATGTGAYSRTFTVPTGCRYIRISRKTDATNVSLTVDGASPIPTMVSLLSSISSDLSDEVTRATNAEESISFQVAQIQEDIDNVEEVIPPAATSSNQLADKEFVNSTVGTNTDWYNNIFPQIDPYDSQLDPHDAIWNSEQVSHGSGTVKDKLDDLSEADGIIYEHETVKTALDARAKKTEIVKDMMEQSTTSWTESGVLVYSGAVPAASASLGTIGQVTYDANYLYICIAENTWKRIAFTEF